MGFRSSRFLSAIVSIGLLGALGAPALADQRITPDMLKGMTPEQVRETLLKQVREQAQRRAQTRTSGTDVTPPVLTKFSLNPKVDAGGYITGTATLSDDQSGVANFYGQGYGPSGWITFSMGTGFPAKKLTASLSESTSPYLKPGTYEFNAAWAYDVAGNLSFYDQSTLPILGNTVVTVTNPLGSDTRAPQLVSGKILTTSLALSALQPGADVPAYAGMEVKFKDSGEAVISGLYEVMANFCLLDMSNCFWMSAYPRAVGASKSTVLLGVQPAWVGAVPGEYHLVTIRARDMANNYSQLDSIEIGGATDFTTLFPSISVTLTP